jgi:alkylation response protein AidB-like acyl-CoA dehydrogenase
MSNARTVGALIDEIRDHHVEFDITADEAERQGTAPDALDALMRKLRVPMIKAPLEVGGDHLHLADQFRYFSALSYANPTAAWAGFNHAGAAAMAGARLGHAGLDIVFGDNPSPIMAAVSAPSGTFLSVDGGVRLSGTWKYASGVKHSDFALLTAIESGAETPRVRIGIVPTREARVDGDWDVMALKGTGSFTVHVDDVFVPDSMVIDPSIAPLRGGPMFEIGYQAYVAAENLGFTMGVCQRFMDELATYANSKARGFDGRLADRGAFQYEFGKGQLAIDAARAFGLRAFEEADTTLLSGRRLSAREQGYVVAMMAYCTESAANTVSHLFHFAGAGALFNSSILQRCFRDAHGSVQHHVASNIAYDRFGQSLLSLG